MTTIYSLIKGFTLAISSLLFSSTVQAQTYNQDSLLSTLKSHTDYYYVKPMVGLHWSGSEQQGDNRFGPADSFDIRNTRFGFLMGHHRGRFDVEFGVTNLPVYTGYRFTGNAGRVVSTAARITYFQFPLTIQYTVWQPAKHLELRLSGGGAYNWERNGPKIAVSSTRISSSVTLPGGIIETIESNNTTQFRTRFFSGSLGVAFNYQFLDRFALNIQVSRLISSNNVVVQNAEVQEQGIADRYNVRTQAGAGNISLLLGLIYRFKTSKRYSLNDNNSTL